MITKVLYDWASKPDTIATYLDATGWETAEDCRKNLKENIQDFSNAKVYKVTITVEEVPNE